MMFGMVLSRFCDSIAGSKPGFMILGLQPVHSDRLIRLVDTVILLPRLCVGPGVDKLR